MWEYRAPGAPCFTAPVKPRARHLLNSMSAGTSTEVLPTSGGRKPSGSENTPQSNESPQSMSTSETPKHDEDGSWVSSPKDCVFPETIPEEASSVEEERVVIFRLPQGTHTMDSSFYTADASLLQQQHSQNGGGRQKETTKFDFDKIDFYDKTHKFDGIPKSSTSTEKDSIDSGGGLKSPPISKFDLNAATFLDVAVLRCLFVSHWQEEGVYWSLHYLYNRLREISEDSVTPPSQPKKRSNSLPIPQIEISVYQGPGSTNSRDSPSGSSTAKDYIEIPDPPIVAHLSEDSQSTGRRSSEKKRRVKMSDLRTFVETRMFSKSDRTLEKVGLDNGKRLEHVVSVI